MKNTFKLLVAALSLVLCLSFIGCDMSAVDAIINSIEEIMYRSDAADGDEYYYDEVTIGGMKQTMTTTTTTTRKLILIEPIPDVVQMPVNMYYLEDYPSLKEEVAKYHVYMDAGFVLPLERHYNIEYTEEQIYSYGLQKGDIFTVISEPMNGYIAVEFEGNYYAMLDDNFKTYCFPFNESGEPIYPEEEAIVEYINSVPPKDMNY